MKQVTLNIPDGKFDFFMELFEKLGLDTQTTLVIPEWQKELVLNRIKASNNNPERLLDWEDVKDSFKLDQVAFHVKIEAEARVDIQSAIDWYNEQKKGLGKRFLNETRTAIVRRQTKVNFSLVGVSC